MIQLIAVSLEDDVALEFIKSVYIDSFPDDERREFDNIIQLLHHNTLFHLILLYHDKQPIGFISYWQWDDISYIEHFAVDSSQRGSGYGVRGLTALLAQLHTPVVLEVEPPTTPLACRRIGFYQRIGFTLCNRPYTQPPYSPDKQSVQLLFMSYGAINLNEVFDTIVSRLHQHVYGMKEKRG